MQKRAAIYVRVSTDKQTTQNQVTVLRQIAGTVQRVQQEMKGPFVGAVA